MVTPQLLSSIFRKGGSVCVCVSVDNIYSRFNNKLSTRRVTHTCVCVWVLGCRLGAAHTRTYSFAPFRTNAHSSFISNKIGTDDKKVSRAPAPLPNAESFWRGAIRLSPLPYRGAGDIQHGLLWCARCRSHMAIPHTHTHAAHCRRVCVTQILRLSIHDSIGTFVRILSPRAHSHKLHIIY